MLQLFAPVCWKSSQMGNINIDDFRVIASKTYPNFPFKISTPLYPEWAFAKTLKASDGLSKSVALALLSLESNSLIAQKAQFQEWTFPYDYQPVHNLLKIIKVGPYRDHGKISVIDAINQYKVEITTVLILVLGLLMMTIAVYRTNIKLSNERLEKEKTMKNMEYLATHDPLTDLYNRKMLTQKFTDELFRASRYDHSLSIFMLDIDHFKQINDTYSHQTGDAVLSDIAKTLKGSLRKTDFAARYGGEEFIIILPETPLLEAEELAGRLCNKIAGYPIPITGDEELNITVSIGVATFPEHAQSWEDMLNVVDSAMYTAKKAGRNCVKVAEISFE